MIQDIQIRWNSTYLMVIGALLLRKYLDQGILELDNIKLQLLSIFDIEGKQVKYVLAILYSFWKCTQAISVSRGITIHGAWQVYNRLFQHLEDGECEAENEDQGKEPLLRALGAAKEKLKVYYGRTKKEKSIIYAVTIILDPSGQLSAYDSDTGTSQKRKSYKKQILVFYKENYLKFKAQSTTISFTSDFAIEITILSNNHKFLY